MDLFQIAVNCDGDILTVAFKTRGIKNVQRNFVKIV